MSLQSDKKTLETQITRYMTLLSNLKKPDADYIESVGYIRGMVQSANKNEIGEMKSLWQQIKPTDARSVTYIETGVIEDAPVTSKANIADLSTGEIIRLTDRIRIINQPALKGEDQL